MRADIEHFAECGVTSCGIFANDIIAFLISVNSPVVNLLTFCLGETLHNNHHARPANYDYREHWYEFDLTAVIIKYFFAKKL